MDKLDFKKDYKNLYLPKQRPALVTVPPATYLMTDGKGAPEEPAYQQAIQLLYSVSFTIKMSKMSGSQPEGYVEYVVPPLEGLWNCGPEGFDPDRHQWRWTSLLRQPDFVTPEVVRWAAAEAAKKHPELPFDKLRLETYDEGLCVQMLHLGPYTEEQKTIDELVKFMDAQGYTYDRDSGRRHHEVYLSDPRRTAAEKLKTVLRLPVRKR